MRQVNVTSYFLNEKTITLQQENGFDPGYKYLLSINNEYVNGNQGDTLQYEIAVISHQSVHLKAIISDMPKGTLVSDSIKNIFDLYTLDLIYGINDTIDLQVPPIIEEYYFSKWICSDSNFIFNATNNNIYDIVGKANKIRTGLDFTAEYKKIKSDTIVLEARVARNIIYYGDGVTRINDSTYIVKRNMLGTINVAYIGDGRLMDWILYDPEYSNYVLSSTDPIVSFPTPLILQRNNRKNFESYNEANVFIGRGFGEVLVDDHPMNCTDYSLKVFVRPINEWNEQNDGLGPTNCDKTSD